MPVVEVDEAEILKARQLSATLNKIAANPESRVLLEQARKLVEPEAPTPALDARKSDTDRFSNVEKKINDFIASQESAKTEADAKAKVDAFTTRIETGLAKLRSQGVTEEGLVEVKKIMETEGISNPEIAWNHFEKIHPPQTPVMPGGTGAWNFMEGLPTDGADDLKKLVDSKGENAALLDKMAHTALTEVRGQPRR